MTVSSRLLGAVFAVATLVAVGLVWHLDREAPATCASPAPLVPAPMSTQRERIELPMPLANPEVRSERTSPVIGVEISQPIVQPPDLTDPEEQLIAGNVDLATRAIQLAQQRAANAPGLAAAEQDYELAAAKQSARAREAGYTSVDAN